MQEGGFAIARFPEEHNQVFQGYLPGKRAYILVPSEKQRAAIFRKRIGTGISVLLFHLFGFGSLPPAGENLGIFPNSLDQLFKMGALVNIGGEHVHICQLVYDVVKFVMDALEPNVLFPQGFNGFCPGFFYFLV